jgi:uncharacterized protein YktA (UPF0223 family)
MYTYPIDYDLFTAEEVSSIIEFLSLIEDANEKKVKVDPIVLSQKHKDFRAIINSISMEKKMDRDFEKVSGYSIYKTIKKFKDNLK